jgi:hypothetical protein
VSGLSTSLDSCYAAAQKLLVELQEAALTEEAGPLSCYEIDVLVLDTEDIVSRISNLLLLHRRTP